MTYEPPVAASTPKPRDPRALNAYRHGLTGQVHILTPADEVAYQKHCKGIHQSLVPVGALETDLAQSIADDRWRLQRAAAIECSIFALGVGQPTESSSGNPEVDVALAQARVWLADGKQLQLLGLYEYRMQRRVEKNMDMLRELQQERQAALNQAVEDVAALAKLAEKQSVTFDIERDYPRLAIPPQFDFSNAEILRLAPHHRRLEDSKKYFPPAKKPLHNAA
jgi:hypothetical protein